MKIIELHKGAYIIHKETEELKYIIIATGLEVPIFAIDVANEIKNIRVISMFSCELFDKQNIEYKNNLLQKIL